jgi:acyl carrier protein
MTPDEILTEVRVVTREFTDAGDDDPLDLESLELVQLAEAVEARFGLVLSGRDLVPEYFGTIRRLAAHVAYLRAHRP